MPVMPTWLTDFQPLSPPLLEEPLARHTSFGIGGPAEIFAVPTGKRELSDLLKRATGAGVQVQILGSGSNCLVSDDGLRGLVISLAGTLRELTIDGSQVTAQSGVMLGHMVKICLKSGMTGMESLVGVPGTVGGALVMNAGAFGGEISTYLERATVVGLDGTDKIYSVDDLTFSYRHSSFRSDEIILDATFTFPQGNRDESAEKKSDASAKRKANQPLQFRSAGSVFKNPTADIAAGYLIDRAGLKGSRKGDAEISPKHANFIVNHGSASADDVAYLIKLAMRTVHELHGIKLQLEIKTLGFAPDFWKEIEHV